MSGDNLSVGEDTEREPSGIMSDKVYRSTEEVPNEQELILEGKTSVSHDNSVSITILLCVTKRMPLFGLFV